MGELEIKVDGCKEGGNHDDLVRRAKEMVVKNRVTAPDGQGLICIYCDLEVFVSRPFASDIFSAELREIKGFGSM
jgi:hypothetical protein